MKKTILFGCLCFVFLMAYGYGEQTRPMAVSPGGESGLVVVSQSCPTFSWSAVEWSNAYKVAVFPAVGAEVLTYEEMELLASPVVSKEISGPALSWTPSEEERLASGEAYVWYVQAVDASGIGVWSEGRMFQVDETVRILGVKEKLRESLKEYGMSEEDIEQVLTEATSDLQAVEVKGSTELGAGYSGVDQGTEGAQNTYYGQQAGASATGIYNSFFGVNAGRITSGNSNLFMGVSAGYANTTGHLNNFLGSNAGRYNTTGSRNTFQGNSAGYSNTTGNNNSFFGWGAGYNSVQSENSFFGSYAGYSNTSGTSNVFMGYQAGYSNNTGLYNTMLGTYAGFSNTSGGRNTFIGYNSGYSNSGSYNTMMGTYSGRSNTTGGYNTFIGYHSGYNNISGNYNTMMGTYSGRSNTTGHYNAFLGYHAGYNSNANSNTFIGYYAGRYNTSGHSNTYIGRSAGTGINTGSGNVCLGYSAGPTSNQSNFLYVNNGQSDTPLIFGNFDVNLVIFYDDSDTWVRIYPDSPANRVIDIRDDAGYGAYCTGTTWVDSSSRDVKENIQNLDAEEAIEALDKLEPVKFNYKRDKEEDSVGFIAEDVPDLVATKDRKGMVAMDVVAVLTKVVQEQQAALNEQQNRDEVLTQIVQKQQETIDELRKQIDDLKKRK